ncbi:Cytochrome c oxidase copper chaperone [Mizuhopecten yessoensis]|uniref:Cytochrome c oxidase copper chaperone n=1 Tax=Mizuhopecten yessoensis TaxID=6573 RepID=A0A210Q9V9_MIZYE|nr:Cytochrome c oxidase copper chaperone [Mizuhopecten yessoensis]
MGNANAPAAPVAPTAPAPTIEPAKKLKPCCACPETRGPRDECIVLKGEENCKDLIEAHKECMRKLGFKV